MKVKNVFFIGLVIFSAQRSFATWDVTTPAGTEAKSLGDDRIREFKTDVQSSFQYEGDFPGTDTSNPRFIYTPSTGTTALRPTGNDAPAGRLYVNLSSNTLEMSQGNGTWSALNVIGSSMVTSAGLAVDVAGPGLDGGGGIPLRVNVDSNTFTITNDTVTIKADSIGSSQIANSVTIPTLQVTTATWQNFGILPILQIQSYETSTSSSVTSASFTNTLLSGSFTPKLSSSKVLIWVAGDFAQSGGASVGYATIARNGTSLAATTGGLTTTVATNNYAATMIVYDSPATTSAVTYSVQIRTNGGGAAVFPITDGGVLTSTAKMIIAEIAQ